MVVPTIPEQRKSLPRYNPTRPVASAGRPVNVNEDVSPKQIVGSSATRSRSKHLVEFGTTRVLLEVVRVFIKASTK